MSTSDNLSVEDIEQALLDIENKYEPKQNVENDFLKQSLIMLSQAFDSLGLPTIDLSLQLPQLFEQVLKSTHTLVQIHRKTISEIKDINVLSRGKDHRTSELYKKLDDYKLKLDKVNEKQAHLNNKVLKLQSEKSESKKIERSLKDELKQVKNYCNSKQNESQHTIKKLTKENQKLKELLGQDIRRDEVTLKLLKKYKVNEEMYKGTIKKLQENNRGLMDELLNLKEELAVSLCNNEKMCS